MPAISFPASPSVNDTFTSNGKTWHWNGTFWSLVVSGASVADGSVSTAKIADSAITAAKIADGTVVAAEIANDAITTAKILDANITTAKIASDAVTTAKILNANVTTAKVAANAITQAKLASNLSAVTVTTTANRDTDIPSPFTGQLAVLTDTRKIQLYDGTSWVNVSLAPPETPTSLSATALSTTSVSVAFTAGGANGSPITNYKYALSTNGGSTYGSFIALDPADITTPITISGLTAATTYYIKLKAVNDMGDSVASAAVSIGTLATPDAPTSLSATSSSPTSVSVAFTPGAQGGSAITNYQYALSTNSGSSYGAFTALDPADATSPITISGLTGETAYYIKLKAVNTDGAGTESSAVSFTTPGSISSIDYLVVAGGGAGAIWQGGGGGAGGLRSTVTATGGGGTLETALAVTPGVSYTVTVGAGGAVGSPNVYIQGAKASNGSNSVFATITSNGGGGGSSYSNLGNAQGSTGGSGGGGGSSSGAGGMDGGAGTANQGYSGGSGYASAHGAGGGGGAGASGSSAGYFIGGNGGAGIATTITGSSVFYAGGGGGSGYNGGGSTGGSGIGGNGSVENTGPFVGTAGTVNTGSGGGGETIGDELSGAGGSGIVILRFPNTKVDIASIGAGLTYTFTNTGGYKIYRFTAGSGSITI